MGGEDQLKGFIRQAFSLQNSADRAVLDVDELLGRVMLNVRRMVEGLPEESLLRDKAWADLVPFVKVEMAPYALALQQAVVREEVAAAPEMKAYAVREAEKAGAAMTQGLGAPLPSSVVAQVGRAKVGKARFRELFMPKQGPVTPWTEQMFKVVDRNVRAGIIQGMTTQQIADSVVHETISKGVKGVSLRGQTSVRTIRAQALTMSRTVTQDVNRMIKEELWEANADALEGFEYQWSSALDSRTCQICAPLDGRRWKKKEDAEQAPIHPNCRCQVLLVDPEDEFWNEGKRTGQQISETPYKNGYKTKVKVKGERYYRKAKEFTGNDYGDYLASSNLLTQTEFFGGGPIGQRRARYFRSQLDKMNKDPQEILAQMLMGPTNAKKFIPLPELAKNNVVAIKPKAAVKVKPKPAPTPAPTPKPPSATAIAEQAEQRALAKLSTQMGTAELDKALKAATKKTVAKVRVPDVTDIKGINPAPLFENSVDSLGRGMFGEARLTQKGVVKRGWLNRNELKAMEALSDTGYTPKLLGSAFAGEWYPDVFPGFNVRLGYLLMERAPGVTLQKIPVNKSRAAFEQLMKGRKSIHLKGIAHQDMHQNNVMYDVKTDKLTILDMGVARVDSRAALVEALGTGRGKLDLGGKVLKAGDYQSAPMFTQLNSNGKTRSTETWKRFQKNRKAVIEKLITEGAGDTVNASIRKLPRSVTKNLTSKRALELLRELYEGI